MTGALTRAGVYWRIMRKITLKHASLTIIATVLLYWLPFICITAASVSRTASAVDELPQSDAVLVFGTLVNKDMAVSPLLEERLEAGIAILGAGKCGKIVVSNMKDASGVMARYLYSRGVDPGLVEIDPMADDTPDTCTFARSAHPEGRRVIFVSQGFHLPRILYQCRKAGVEGRAFPAETLRTRQREEYSLMTKILTRSSRYTREAGLTWLALLGIYR